MQFANMKLKGGTVMLFQKTVKVKKVVAPSKNNGPQPTLPISGG